MSPADDEARRASLALRDGLAAEAQAAFDAAEDEAAALAWWVLIVDPRGPGRPIRALGEGTIPDWPFRSGPRSFTREEARRAALALRHRPRKSPRLFAIAQARGPGYEVIGYGGGRG